MSNSDLESRIRIKYIEAMKLNQTPRYLYLGRIESVELRLTTNDAAKVKTCYAQVDNDGTITMMYTDLIVIEVMRHSHIHVA